MKRVSDIILGLEALPEADINKVLAGRRPLILAPHADDESLGCGGLIALACIAGIAPSVVILTDGSASHPNSPSFPPERLRNLRELETQHAVKHLGLPLENLYFLRYEDTRLPNTGSGFEIAVKQVIKIGKLQKSSIIIGPWKGDPHCDHEAGADIAAAVAAYTGWPLLSYPVWGWLRDAADLISEGRVDGWRLNIAAQLDRKQRAISEHASQYGDLIKDSPDCFRLPKNLLALFERPFEVFIA